MFLPCRMKSFSAITQPIVISPLPPNYALHTLEEGEFFRKYVKWRQIVNGVLQEWPKACFSDENYVDFFELFMYGL